MAEIKTVLTRDAFEFFIAQGAGLVRGQGSEAFSKHEGIYLNDSMQRMWVGYQAAQAILEDAAASSSNIANIEPETIDANVQRNIDLLRSRSQVGIAKYGITTDKSGLTRKQWKQHLLEELLDAANYIQAELNTDED